MEIHPTDMINACSHYARYYIHTLWPSAARNNALRTINAYRQSLCEDQVRPAKVAGAWRSAVEAGTKAGLDLEKCVADCLEKNGAPATRHREAFVAGESYHSPDAWRIRSGDGGIAISDFLDALGADETLHMASIGEPYTDRGIEDIHVGEEIDASDVDDLEPGAVIVIDGPDRETYYRREAHRIVETCEPARDLVRAMMRDADETGAVVNITSYPYDQQPTVIDAARRPGVVIIDDTDGGELAIYVGARGPGHGEAGALSAARAEAQDCGSTPCRAEMLDGEGDVWSLADESDGEDDD